MLLEIVKIAYDNPATTIFFLLGLALIVGEFRPVAIVKYEPGHEKETKNDEKHLDI